MASYLGIDYGEKRIGLAHGDELGLAVPLPAAVQPKKRDRIAHIVKLAEERRVQEVVIGWPLNMDGSAGFKAKEVEGFIAELTKALPLPVHKIDERLTSREASARLRESGRKVTRQSGELDSRAATLILQDFLEQRHPAEDWLNAPGRDCCGDNEEGGIG